MTHVPSLSFTEAIVPLNGAVVQWVVPLQEHSEKERDMFEMPPHQLSLLSPYSTHFLECVTDPP